MDLDREFRDVRTVVDRVRVLVRQVLYSILYLLSGYKRIGQIDMCNWVYGGENNSGQGRCFSQIGNNRGNGIMSILYVIRGFKSIEYICMFKCFFDKIFVLLDFD